MQAILCQLLTDSSSHSFKLRPVSLSCSFTELTTCRSGIASISTQLKGEDNELQDGTQYTGLVIFMVMVSGMVPWILILAHARPPVLEKLKRSSHLHQLSFHKKSTITNNGASECCVKKAYISRQTRQSLTNFQRLEQLRGSV